MNFLPFPELESERLNLKEICQDDFEDILFLRSDKSVNKYIKRALPQNIENVKYFVRKVTLDIQNNQVLYWVIKLKGSEKMIASICLWKFSNDRKTAEVGYDLHPSFQNLGIMNEALNCVTKFGFETLNLNEIKAYTNCENEKSKKLLVKNKFRLILGEKDENNLANLIFSLKK